MGIDEDDALPDTVPEVSAEPEVTRAGGRRAPRGTDPDPTADHSEKDLASLERDSFTARYRDMAMLGRGGMGEVRLTRDNHIGRDVALKVMHESWRELNDELRKRLAEEHAEAAAAEATALLTDGSESERHRKSTMQHISRALAFDPMNALALKTLLRVLTEMPRYTTKATRHEYARLANAKVKKAMGVASRAYLAWLFTLPLMLWMGVRDTRTCGALVALAILTATSAYACSQLERVGAALQYGVFLLSCVTLGIASSWFGPLMLVPSAVAVNTLGFAMTDVKRRRYAFVGLGLLTILVPTLLQILGVVPASYSFVDGELHVLPQLTDMPATASLAALVFTSLVTIAVSSLSAGHLRTQLAEAEQKLLNFTWHLRQLLPTHVLDEVE